MKITEILKEHLGVWGLVAHSRKKLGLNEADPSLAGRLPARPGVPMKPDSRTPVAPTNPAPKPPAPKAPVQKSSTLQQKPDTDPVPAPENDNLDYSLNYKVGSGYKVKFAGKPGEFYIIRVMDGAMKNFLVANKVLGIKQFYNVRVESVLSDEHNKPFKSDEAPSDASKEASKIAAESLMESYQTFIQRGNKNSKK